MTACAAASAPLSLTTARNEYGGTPRTVPALRGGRQAIRSVCRRFPSTTSWPSGRKIPTTAMPVWWSPSWVFFVPLLTDAGVTSFHVTLANHSSLEDTIPPAKHPYFKEQGCFLKFCDEVRQYTDKPITGVGGLNQPDFVEQQLASGRITCAAMSRQLLADPEWPNKVISGKIKEIHRCVRCNKKMPWRLAAASGYPLHL